MLGGAPPGCSGTPHGAARGWRRRARTEPRTSRAGAGQDPTSAPASWRFTAAQNSPSPSRARRAQVLSKTYTRIDFLSLHSYPIFKETYDYWASNSPNMQARRPAAPALRALVCVYLGLW